MLISSIEYGKSIKDSFIILFIEGVKIVPNRTTYKDTKLGNEYEG